MRENVDERSSMMPDGNREESSRPREEAFNARQHTRGLFDRQKIVHVMGVIVTILILYALSMPLAALRMSVKTDEDVEETSRLLLALSSKQPDIAVLNISRGYINRSENLDHHSRFERFEMVGEDDQYEFRIVTPAPIVSAGPTGSGKTVMMRRLIERSGEICTNPPEEIIYCYGSWQSAFESMPNVTFHEGLIDFKALPSDGKHRWLIIDDLMSESSGNREVEDAFTKHSHHKNITVFLLVQNFFNKGFRTVTLNAHYLFLFKNPRDASQIGFLARQLFPDNPKFLIESYKDATSTPHSYLTLDLKQNTPDDFRVLGNSLPEDPSQPIVVYTPK